MLARIFFMLYGLLSLTGPHAAEPPGALYVNLAGEERMLSQRLAKAYVQMGLGVVPEIAERQMRDAIVRFDANLERLRALDGDADVAAALAALTAEWSELKRAAAVPPSRDAALRLSSLSIGVVDAAERATRAIENAFPHDVGRLVNVAGRQRMLSQRVAKAYLLQSWGAPTATVRDEMAAASGAFAAQLASLLAEPGNTPEIRAELEETALQWEWLQTALAADGAFSYRLVVAEAADAILQSADRITRLYQRLEAPGRAPHEEERQ